MIVTIGIPTFNGAKFLASCIDNVIGEIGSCPTDVNFEIFIQDNGSTDGTAAIIFDFQRRYPQLVKHSRHETNVGYDRNILSLLKNSTGHFVKILADDDQFATGGLHQTVKTLKEHPDIDVLISNFDTYDELLNSRVSSLVINGGQSALFTDGHLLIEKSALRFGQVSSLVFRKNFILHDKLERFIGCQYIHIAALFASGPTIKSYLEAGSTIKVRAGSPNFEKSTVDKILVPIGAIRIFRNARKDGWGRSTIDVIVRFHQKYVLRRAVAAKADGLIFESKLLITLLKECWDYWAFWFLYTPLLVLPAGVAKVIESLKKANRRLALL